MEDDLRLYFTYDESRVGGEPTSDSPWCSLTDTHVTVKFNYLYKDPPKDRFFYDSIVINEPSLLEHSSLYLCVIRYSTGSSFGTKYGYWCVVGVAKSVTEAQNLLDGALINGVFKYGYMCKPWEGYFERFEDTEIHELIVK